MHGALAFGTRWTAATLSPKKKWRCIPDDSEETLAARVLAAEHQLYPQTLARPVEGRIEIIFYPHPIPAKAGNLPVI